MPLDTSPKVIIQMAPAVLLLIGAALEMQGGVRKLYGLAITESPHVHSADTIWASGTRK